MGIPALYKWLCGKYPKIIESVKNTSSILDENSYGVNNVNIFDVDNFYIDTNGLIHPVCHPQGVEPPESEEEMYELIIKLLKRLIFMIHPKNLIYIAIDGVAPRAKMNQQRIRRANAARDAEIEEKISKEIIEEMKEKGLNNIPEYKKKWDSNAITPGTTFMIKLNEKIKEFIKNDLMKNERLKDVKIIFNSSEVVGEGEHKIMSFIRQQRLYPSYNANSSHCIYGLDADLIILSLATHEVNMKILRENNNNNNNNVTIQFKDINDIIYKSEYEILNISTLREYLGRIEFSKEEFKELSFEYNFEHIIDDLILLIMLVGNDFLPHIPSINIREGGIDVMIYYYKKYLNSIGGYLMCNNRCVFNRLSKYFKELSKLEPIIFKLRKENEKSYEEYLSRKLSNNNNNNNNNENTSIKRSFNDNNENESNKRICNNNNSAMLLSDGGYSDNDNYRYSKLLRKEIFDEDVDDEKEKEEEEEEKKEESNEMEIIEEKEETKEIDTNKELFQNKIHEKCYNEKKLIYEDKIHFEEDGYRERYYRIKFELENEIEIEIEEFISKVSMEYMKGIDWIINYYYEECISWNWYYPYHYSPFLIDLCLIDECKWKFELNKPFGSLEQLMSVLPSRSSELVPKCYKDLMIDPNSAIFEYYKNDFKIDPNGNYQPWLYVSLLDVIDEELLLKTLKSKENELSEEEKKRNFNKVNEMLLYISKKNSYIENILKFVKDNEYVLIADIGLNGLIKKEKIEELEDDEKDNNNFIELNYKLEEPLRKHNSSLLGKAKLPLMKLSENDVYVNNNIKKGFVYKYVLENIH